MRERFGVTREVEPVTAPTLAVLSARQRAIDERRESRVARICCKRAQISLARREAGEIKRRTPQQRAWIDVVRGCSEARGFASGQHEAIDVASRPFNFAHDRRGRIFDGAKRPRLRVLRAGSDPRINDLDLFCRRRFTTVGRHAQIWIHGVQPMEHRAGAAVARLNRARLAREHCRRAIESIQPKPCLARFCIGSVAWVTAGNKYGTHFAVVVHRRVRENRHEHRERAASEHDAGDRRGREDSMHRTAHAFSISRSGRRWKSRLCEWRNYRGDQSASANSPRIAANARAAMISR